ncbi:DUF4350 domain-containing protein [Nocardioides marmorisolisilvae]|uniref:DUF4350 domain-containing protein n=1 Tax=Nocardioides marmorisolisilvae TaxID=1542737 RepID=A0A3N0DZL2_9ACTN|nr:DUF4350 domain-containing protein [Nocardioides marmorisolisilvae]RNL81032.1 DUF4350 domain-containing protein [Nocardioides marmorisolisilvae]
MSAVEVDEVGPTTAGAAGFLRRNRVAVALGLAVLCTLLLVTWQGRDTGRNGILDPENAAPHGARALAQVLGDHGVPVDVVRGRRAFEDAQVDGNTTVVVSNPWDLGRTTYRDLEERLSTATGSELVVAGIAPAVADALGLKDKDFSTATDRDRTPADCSPAQPLLDGLTLDVPGSGLGVPGDGCFGDQAGRLLLVGANGHRWVLVDPSPLSNDRIDVGDNAAVALRLLGQRDRVVWYVADPDEVQAGDGTGVGRLLPRWLVPSVWLIAIAAVALLLYRGRRLGPLVTEPMPVTIKALESTTALGRLYERARDRWHAAELLIEGTVRRLRQVLGLSPTATREEVVRAVATRTGRPVEAITGILDRVVRTDADLVTLANELTHLEEEVRTV